MMIHKTTEGYINLRQEGKSFELMVSRIEDKVSELLQAKGLDETDIIVELDYYLQSGYEVCSIGLGDISDAFVYLDMISFLSKLLQIDKDVLKEFDYLNLRNF